MECKRCGECCRYVGLVVESISPKELIWLQTRGIFVYFGEKIMVIFRQDCQMLDGDLCRLHGGAKPQVCREETCPKGERWFEEARKYYAYH